jgi:hypothetical protein
MCSSFINVGIRGKREVNLGVSSNDPNEVVASLRNLSFQKLRSQWEPTTRYSSSEKTVAKDVIRSCSSSACLLHIVAIFRDKA